MFTKRELARIPKQFRQLVEREMSMTNKTKKNCAPVEYVPAWLAKAHSLPTPVAEYRFHPTRRWRFDYAWPEHRVAVEIEGGTRAIGQSRHTSVTGFAADIEKYNEATVMGWRVLRYLPPKRGVYLDLWNVFRIINNQQEAR